MTDLFSLVDDVLTKGYLLSLATSDTHGLWVADVSYVHRDLQIYWASHVLSRHSRALERNPFAAGSITLTQKAGEEDISVQMAGLARRVEEGSEDLLKKYRTKSGKADFVLHEGYAWYCLEPNLIDLIYEPEFGKEKQRVLPVRAFSAD